MLSSGGELMTLLGMPSSYISVARRQSTEMTSRSLSHDGDDTCGDPLSHLLDIRQTTLFDHVPTVGHANLIRYMLLQLLRFYALSNPS